VGEQRSRGAEEQGSRGAGEQGGFKEVFLSFIAGGAPPVGLLLTKNLTFG